MAEIRGIAAKQNIEPEFTRNAMKKARKLPGGDMYEKRAHDMTKLTQIAQQNEKNEGISADELRFLYEIDDTIEGFGNERDPRINEIIETRNFAEDIRHIFGTTDFSSTFEAINNQLGGSWQLVSIVGRLVDACIAEGVSQDEIFTALLTKDDPFGIGNYTRHFSGLSEASFRSLRTVVVDHLKSKKEPIPDWQRALITELTEDDAKDWEREEMAHEHSLIEARADQYLQGLKTRNSKLFNI